MARKVKFSVTTAGLLKQVAVLILLSATAESLQCYWCGPLAEQVHRSQRAPSCDTLENHITACDPGFTHCAVVASSPPLAESRYCVKFYQDECYILYCNTTNTYRMTCPCRGDLCNGPKTEREIEAFATLAKSVARTQNNRIKKRNAISTKRIVTAVEEKMNAKQNYMEMSNASSNIDKINNDLQNDISENIKIGIKNETFDLNMQSDQAVTIEPQNNPLNETTDNSTNMTDKKIEDKDISTNTTVSNHEIQEISESTTAKIADDNHKNVEMTTKGSTITVAPTHGANVEKFASNDIQPSVALPTAEALQQNSGQVVTSEKPMDTTTTESTYMTTLKIKTKKNPTNATRNKAEAVFTGTFLVIRCLIVHLMV